MGATPTPHTHVAGRLGLHEYADTLFRLVKIRGTLYVIAVGRISGAHSEPIRVSPS
jgi:hypothetical protein